MRRGTTPTHTFDISPIEASVLSKVKITYAQGNTVVLVKRTEDCTLEGNTIKLTLTQEETLKFDHKKLVEVQVRVLTAGGDALASYIHNVTVGRLLDEEVLT